MEVKEHAAQKVKLATGGVGADVILDYESQHTPELKKFLIECLAVHGRWVICDSNF